jgi:hypothetical protein
VIAGSLIQVKKAVPNGKAQHARPLRAKQVNHDLRLMSPIGDAAVFCFIAENAYIQMS